MFRIGERFRPLGNRRGKVLFLLACLTISGAWAADNWSDAPADLSIREYLDLQFQLTMMRPESDTPNSFSLVSFYPSSHPRSGLVFVLQTWRDERLQPQNLRREIRKVGEAYVNQFHAMANHPYVSKRWRVVDPKKNIIVRHVRLSDLRETLAVTIGGETVFDKEKISTSKAEAVARGAVWSW